MTVRPFIFWPHLIAAVFAGVLIVTMSVTGVLLTYERQLIAWSDSHLRSAPPAADAPRLPVEAILERFRREHPDVTPTAVTMASAPDATVVLAVPERTLHLDAYTGQVLGEGATGVRRVMSSLRSWHRWLAVEGDGRPIARALTGWSNVLFLFIVVSGAYLWLPRTWSWRQVRNIAWFRGGLRGKARDFNWHNAIGLWSVIPLFIVVISAVPISFPWGNALVYRAVGEEPPAQGGRGGAAAAGRQGGAPGREAGAPAAGREGGERQAVARERGAREGSAREGSAVPERQQAAGEARPARGGREGGEREGGAPRAAAAASFDGLDELWTSAAAHVPGWRTINLRLPNSERAPVVFAIDRGDGGQPHLRSTLTLDRASGAIVTDENFSSLTLGRRIRNVMRFAHTGEVLGIPGQTIAGLATFGSLVLVWTGIALSLRRLSAWLRRRRNPAAGVVSSRDSAAA
jgi:uncharacterized iron-regulated membrane protein